MTDPTLLERRFVGSIWSDPSLIPDALELVQPSQLLDHVARVVYAQIATRARDGKPWDEVAMYQWLSAVHPAEFSTVAGWSTDGPSSVPYLAGHILTAYRRRAVSRVLDEARSSASDLERCPIETAEDAAASLLKLSGAEATGDDTADTLATEAMDALLIRQTAPGGVAGLPTGIGALDVLLGGLCPSHLGIIAARPGMGKTALMTGLMAAAGACGYSVGCFSLEMSPRQLIDRLIVSEASGDMVPAIDLSSYNAGTLRSFQLREVRAMAETVRDWRLRIDPRAQVTIDQIAAKARRWHIMGGLDLLVVDYAQLVSAGDHKGRSREQEVAAVSRTLKLLARDLDIPVVLLAQLNRGLESRQDKRPLLSDLRESGGLEQDADWVLMLYRAHVYDEAQPEGVAEAILRKHRHRRLGTVTLRWTGPCVRFDEVTR